MQNKFQIWLLAARPKTLPAAITPVMIGTAMALGDGFRHALPALAALVAALAIQIGTNFANDYFDHQKGADKDRIGPTRVMQAGLVSPVAMRWAMVLAFGAAALAAAFLIHRAGWPILVIAVVSILSGIFYTAGPRPLGYIGLGELFVLVFFGPVAVAGTYYVQTLELNPAVVLAGLGPGFLSVAVLAVNNFRDINTDRAAGKRTLAVRFGRSFAMSEYLTAVLVACLTPVGIYALIDDRRWMLLAVLTVFKAVPAIRTVFTTTDGPSLNRALAQTGELLLLYGLLFSLGWML